MKEETAKELLKKVKQDYEIIAKEFSKTREQPWEEFEYFKQHVKQGNKIADIGCGNGRLLKTLGTDFDYIGIDKSKKMIAEAKKCFGKDRFKCGDMLDIPLENESKDVVFSIASFHHIPSKKFREKALKEMRRILHSNGLLIISVWNLFQKKSMAQIFKSLFSPKYDFRDIFVKWGNSGVARYYHAFTPWELKNMIKNAGFDILEMYYTKHEKKTKFWDAYNICVIARKV